MNLHLLLFRKLVVLTIQNNGIQPMSVLFLLVALIKCKDDKAINNRVSKTMKYCAISVLTLWIIIQALICLSKSDATGRISTLLSTIRLKSDQQLSGSFIPVPNLQLHIDCLTSEKEGGRNGQGKKCIFPFVYQNITYINCTKNDAPTNKPWCSTQVDSNHHHIEDKGYWGVCLDGCRVEGNFYN